MIEYEVPKMESIFHTIGVRTLLFCIYEENKNGVIFLGHCDTEPENLIKDEEIPFYLDQIPILENACTLCGKIGTRFCMQDDNGICEICCLVLINPNPENVQNTDRVLMKHWSGGEYEISRSLLSGSAGIVVKLMDGPPDTLNMTVYWSEAPADIIILDEVLESEFYRFGTNPLLLDYGDGLLFRLIEWNNNNPDLYLLENAFTKQEAILHAEIFLQKKYASIIGEL